MNWEKICKIINFIDEVGLCVSLVIAAVSFGLIYLGTTSLKTARTVKDIKKSKLMITFGSVLIGILIILCIIFIIIKKKKNCDIYLYKNMSTTSSALPTL